MNTFAAVMTGQGVGAISTIQVFGDRAEAVVKKIFKPESNKPAILKPGKILLGQIIDGSETIDQVTIGCESAHSYDINCHGNPLIVEMIMQLLQRHGVTLLTAEQLLAKALTSQKNVNTIAIEAKLAQAKAKTIEGTKIIANQIDAGLNKTANQWLQDTIALEQIKGDVERILENSRTAKLIIAGCKTVIAGPTNTGKSTLFNCLCGRQKAIVTDIKGTTRDWVGAQCRIGSLCLELIDTAGLDKTLAAAPDETIERQAQEKSVQILEGADLVLLVLDSSQTADQLDEVPLEKITEGKILTVLNKSDLPAGLDTTKLPEISGDTVQISAKFETGIEKLIGRIRRICGVADFDLKTAVCVTGRQENLLKQLKKAKSKEQAVSIITELLNGEVRV